MTESYELPVLFTDDECKAYAAWGMKKEKVLMPFALITILIYMVATVLVVMKVWGVRESDHLLFQMLLWGLDSGTDGSAGGFHDDPGTGTVELYTG